MTKKSEETKFLTQKPARRRVQLTCPEKSITDQTESDLSPASVRRKLEKGLFVNNYANDLYYPDRPLQFTNLQDALDFHQVTTRQFENLPIELRQKMGNKVANLEPFFTDPANSQILKDYGFLPPDRDPTTLKDLVQALKDHRDPPKKAPETP